MLSVIGDWQPNTDPTTKQEPREFNRNCNLSLGEWDRRGPCRLGWLQRIHLPFPVKTGLAFV